MNIRCTLPTRIAAFIIMTAAMVLAAASARAQTVDCSRCDHFTFGVSASMSCGVEICYTYSPEGPVFCRTVGIGRALTITCPVYQAWVTTCSGPYYIVPANADVACSPQLKFASDCCGRICVVPNVEDCTRLEVQPLPCLSAGCP